jgi:hypothetical protein
MFCGKVTHEYTPQQEFMTDKFIYMLGKKLSPDVHVPEDEIYIWRHKEGDREYLVSPKMLHEFNQWLDAHPLLKALS